MEINYKEDLIQSYADKRKALSKEDVEDFYRVMMLYLKQKLRSDDVYALEIPYLGILHKKIKEEEVFEYKTARTKKQILNQKMILNAIYKENTPPNQKPKYDYKDVEWIKNHTNNNS